MGHDIHLPNVYILVQLLNVINLKFILSLLGGGLLLYLALGLLLFLIQKKFIFFPTKLKANHVFQDLRPHQEVWLKKSQGAPTHGLYFKAEQDRGLVLFFHGNAGALDKWGHAANAYLGLGYSVFIIDYRGFGKSVGKITEDGLKEDVLLAYDWSLEKYPADKIFACGRSLGTGLATWLATQKTTAALILETPYTSLIDMARLNIAYYPLKYLMRYQLNNVDFVAQSLSPVYVIHGTEDELIPYEMAQKVAAQNGELFTIPGASHNDLPNFDAYHDYLQKIFLAHE